jgi:serine/threonine-protein kinase
MSDSEARSPDDVPLPIQREIDPVCQSFEEAWQAGQRPRIEDYLGATPEPARSALLRMLLKQELEYRVRNGEQPTEDEYACHFPGQEEVVKQVFALPQVPGYKVLARIGKGGMGVVYKALHLKLDLLVALKMSLDGEMASADEVERFKTDARALAQLNHPNIVTICDVGEHAGRHYFAMKLFPDGSLADQVARSPLPSRRAAEIVAKVARAIHYAHQQNIIHRDLKPANILLDKAGQPHVADFGLAKRLDAEATRTRTGAVVGTPGYLSPEQAAGRDNEPTPAMDVYGLGAVLYALLTGRPPFQAESLLETLIQTQDQDRRPVPPRSLNPNIHEDLETVCLKCLEKGPGKRYATAEEVADELGLYLCGKRPKARPPSWVRGFRDEIEKRQEVLDPLSWSYVALLGAAVTFCVHTATFWITQPGGPTFLFGPCMCLNAVLTALIYWYYLLRRRQPLRPEERQILAIVGYVYATGLALFATAFPYDRENILAMYPALALLCGFYHFVIARLYWGPFYQVGLAYCLLAFVMKLKPEWAPLEYAVLNGGHSLATGLVLRRAHKSRSRS